MPAFVWYHYGMLKLRVDRLITWLDRSLASGCRHNTSCLDLSGRSSTNLGHMYQLMQIWGLRSLMAATGHWALWKHTWASGMWPSSGEGEGRGVVGGREVRPGVSPASCLHCHPSSGRVPTCATSHWASGFDQTSLQSFHFSSYLCLSYGYDSAFSVEEAPQTAYACWLVFVKKKKNNTERKWKMIRNAHYSRNATFRPHY